MEDTRKMEPLEQELTDQQTQTEQEVDILLDDGMLSEIIAEDAKPAFDDPDKIYEPAEPMVYCNYSNDYGKDAEEEEIDEAEAIAMQKKKNDKIIIGLMIAASVLCLGIMGILIYWWETFLI